MVPKETMAFQFEAKLNKQGKKFNEGFLLNFEKCKMMGKFIREI